MKLPLSVAGLLLAVAAESCAVGLVGLSGWFIASSAVAGASAYSVFSYLAPSGGVRAFALDRDELRQPGCPPRRGAAPD